MHLSSHDLIAALLRTRSTLLLDVDGGPSGDATERLLALSNLTGTMQLCEWVDGELRQLTALPEAVADAAYVPNGGTAAPDVARRAVLAAAVGGNERDQLYLIDLDAAAREPVRDFSELEALTADPDHAHHLAGVAPDGRLVAYTSNRANDIDFDLWTVSLESGVHALAWAGGGWCHPGSGFSPDGRYVSLIRSGDRPLDEDLVLVDVADGTAHWPLPHPEAAALVNPPTWIDATSFYASTNIGRDFSAIVRHDLASGTSETLAGTGEDADSEYVALSRTGAGVLVENRDCATPMYHWDPDGGAREPIAWPEAGLSYGYGLGRPRFSADGAHLYFTLTTPRRNADIYRHTLADHRTVRLTESPAEVPGSQLVGAELHTVASFDGERLQLMLYRPDTAEPEPPVVVIVHGGPEAQSQLQFNPIAQALVAAGYAVVVPNVRGSTGYGKRFAALDDTVRRLDSVADLAAVHGALGALGLDASRAALWGGSYGGYMVLAGVSMQPDLWAAGVDIVGISDLVTFLENTSDYRRAHRELEYGSLEHDRDFLVRASPMTHVDAIRAPLFVIHGRNDPRVPVTEAEQLEANLRARGVTCELLVYDNEGHGLARLENRLDAYPRAIAFLDRVLGR